MARPVAAGPLCSGRGGAAGTQGPRHPPWWGLANGAARECCAQGYERAGLWAGEGKASGCVHGATASEDPRGQPLIRHDAHGVAAARGTHLAVAYRAPHPKDSMTHANS